MNKQGSGLIVALMLMLFMTTLGTIIFQTAQALQALSIERSLYRPFHRLLESLIIYSCQACGKEWLSESVKTAGVQPQASYTVSIQGVLCTVQVGVKKGVVVVRASCPGNRGIIYKREAQLVFEEKRMVIRAWKSC